MSKPTVLTYLIIFIAIKHTFCHFHTEMDALAAHPFPPARSPSPTVRTNFGIVEGFVHRIATQPDGSPLDALIFLGIPYARPPIGDLRFEVVHCLH